MKKIIITTILFLTFLFSANLILAVSIGVSPAVLNYDNMLKQGYAEKNLIFTTSLESPLKVTLEKQGDIKDWISFENETHKLNDSVIIDSKKPYYVKVIARPPKDTKNGNYSGYIHVKSDKLEEDSKGKALGVKAAFMVKVNIEIIGDQIVKCVGLQSNIDTVEKDEMLKVEYSIENRGNVFINPEVYIDIMDKNKNLVYEKILATERIFPTTKNTFIKDISNNLSVGQYFAKINFPQCKYLKEVTFDILDYGALRDYGVLQQISSLSRSNVGDTLPVKAIFKNLGQRTVTAKFIGVIKTTDNKIIELIETDEVKVEPDHVEELIHYFKPEYSTQYIASGRISYNNKLSFEKSYLMNVHPAKKQEESTNMFLINIFIIITIIIILLIIIKKKKIMHHKVKIK